MAFQELKVSPDGHRLINQDGTVFFYLADTAWRLPRALNREETLLYMDKRQAQGFNVLQVVALDECDGLRRPNRYGRRPFVEVAPDQFDPTRPDLEGDDNYWAHTDFIIDQAAARGMYIALLPSWGDKVHRMAGYGPEIFNIDNAFTYGQWLGERYRGRPNMIWVMGGDRPMGRMRHFEVARAMALGIKASGDNHLMTFHPCGAESSADSVGEENWLDFNMTQSGHSRRRYNYEMITKGYSITPAKPILDGEPGYEHHPDDFNPANGYLDEVDCRQEFFWSVLSGACGHTYGSHSVWGFWTPPVTGLVYFDRPGHFCMDWRQALDGKGANAMHIARDIVLSRDFLHAVPAPDLVKDQLPGTNHVPVLRSDSHIMLYIAQGIPATLDSARMPFESFAITWVNPRTGEHMAAGTGDIHSPLTFCPPTGGRGQDWVLVLDKA
jgi:hypothetical protein